MKQGFIWLALLAVVSFLGVPSGWAEVVRGKVAEVDLNTSKLSLTTAEGESLALSFDKEDFIVWKGDDEVEAKEIQAGNEAEVGYYTDEAGVKIASWVDLTPLEATEEQGLATKEVGEATGEETVGTEGITGEAPEQPAEKTTTQEHPGKEHPGK